MSRRYRLGMALARLGDVVVSQIALRDVAMPVMRDLTAATGLTSRVAVLDESYAIVIGRVDAPSSTVRFTANLGKREHLHCSAVGKAMLAALPPTTVHEIVATAGMPGKTPHTITDEPALLAELDGVAPPRLCDRRRGGHGGRVLRRLGRLRPLRRTASARSASPG